MDVRHPVIVEAHFPVVPVERRDALTYSLHARVAATINAVETGLFTGSVVRAVAAGGEWRATPVQGAVNGDR